MTAPLIDMNVSIGPWPFSIAQAGDIDVRRQDLTDAGVATAVASDTLAILSPDPFDAARKSVV